MPLRIRVPSLGDGGGGAGNYNDSVAETLSAADTVSAVLVRTGTVAESGSAADTASAAQVAAASVAETGSAADTVSAAQVAVADVAETASAADTVSADQPGSWSFVGTATMSAASGSITNATEPSGVQDGDLLVAFIAYRDTPNFTLPSGWTLVAQETSGNTVAAGTGSIASAVMAYIVRSGAPDLTFVRTAGDVALGRINAYRGNAASSLLVTQASTTLASASTTATLSGGVTTGNANDLIVAGLAGARNGTASAFDAATDPATESSTGSQTGNPVAGTWLERGDAGSTTGADVSCAVGDAVRATAGATGDISVVHTTSARHALVVGVFKLSVSANTYNDSVSESGSGSDITSAVAVRVGATAETASAADTVSATVVRVGATAESGSASDAVDAAWAGTRGVAETASAADTVDGSVGAATYNVTCAETLSAADTVSSAHVMPSTVAETASAADTPSAGIASSKSCAETASAAETVAASVARVGAVAESGSAADTVSAILAAAGLVAEELAAIDSSTGLGGSDVNNVDISRPINLRGTRDTRSSLSGSWDRSSELEGAL